MGTALFLGDSSIVDRQQIRHALMRIPEVGIRVRQIQGVIDRTCVKPEDLSLLMTLDDVQFAQHYLRGIIASIVQVALYDRHIRRYGQPDLLVGPKGFLPLMQVMSHTMTLSDLVENYLKGASITIFNSNPRLYDLLSLNPSVLLPEMVILTPEELIEKLCEEFNITRIINLGLTTPLVPAQQIDTCFERLQVCDVIEIDPMLTWFWTPQMRWVAS